MELNIIGGTWAALAALWFVYRRKEDSEVRLRMLEEDAKAARKQQRLALRTHVAKARKEHAAQSHSGAGSGSAKSGSVSSFTTTPSSDGELRKLHRFDSIDRKHPHWISKCHLEYELEGDNPEHHGHGHGHH